MFGHKIHDEFGFGPHGPLFGGPRGWRAGRGMIEPAILGALLDKPMHGYEIISYLEDKSHGMWRPSAGSVYPTLQLLEEKGLVVGDDVDGKKTYRLTADGEPAAQEARDTYEKMRNSFRDRAHGFHEGREKFGEIMRLIRDIYSEGGDKKRQELDHAVEKFRDELKKISG